MSKIMTLTELNKMGNGEYEKDEEEAKKQFKLFLEENELLKIENEELRDSLTYFNKICETQNNQNDSLIRQIQIEKEKHQREKDDLERKIKINNDKLNNKSFAHLLRDFGRSVPEEEKKKIREKMRKEIANQYPILNKYSF